MNCDIQHWKSFEVNKDDFAYCDILQRKIATKRGCLV